MRTAIKGDPQAVLAAAGVEPGDLEVGGQEQLVDVGGIPGREQLDAQACSPAWIFRRIVSPGWIRPSA
jgi:hypothetical protein